ncbi:hypothetical protein [Actinosynnema pretiosum]|uniref:hypothetical protein n=1 Tax=Actinosynnema pretiosum TaxID=42197 RepID=UPI0012FE2554|nr:hypothetical protein [Actinosynnema pretiosum]
MTDPKSRSILVVDVERSSDRTNPQKAELRSALYHVLNRGLAGADLGCEPAHGVDDLGDGVLAVFDCEVLPVLDPLVDLMVDELARYNALVCERDRLRLRIGVHFGPVSRDEHGWVGHEMTAAFRALDAEQVKEVLRSANRAEAVVVVTDDVYRSVVRHGYRGLRPDEYRRLEVPTGPVWVRAPGYAAPPVPATETAAPTAPVTPRVVPAGVNFTNNRIGSVQNVGSIHSIDARTTFGGRP